MVKEDIIKFIGRSICLLLILTQGCMPVVSYGQSTDSLERELRKKSHNETEQIEIYNSLTIAYRDLDFQKSARYGKLGLELAEKNNDEKNILKLQTNLGGSYFRAAKYDTAALYLDKGLEIAQKLKDRRFEAIISVTYGAIYQEQSLYDKSLESYLKAVKLLESEGDKKGLSSVYSNIGGIYQILKNYAPALVYFNKAEQLAIKENNQASLANIYISLSDISLHQDKGKDDALNYAHKALHNSKSTGNSFNEASALQMLSRIYYYYGDAEVALSMAKEALQKTRALGFPDLTSHALIDLSNTYLYLKNYEQSIKNAMESLNTDSTDSNVAMNAYANLLVSNAHLGRPELAEQYLKSYRLVLDRYANKSYQNSLSELQVRYETEKKELKIEALEKQRQLYIWLGIVAALLLLIALAFAYIRYRLAISKKKLAEKETQRLEQEKQLVAVQATLDGEAAERTRLARDLHDGLGSMLSAVKLNLPQVQGNALLESVDVSRFQKAIGMLDDSIQELRRVAHHMMPETLLRFGLKVSLSDFCAAIPLARFHYFGNEARLPEKMEIMVYRCIHELVNNVLKHAEATQINVQLVQEADRVSFTVQDNGKGFKPDGTSEGMGLQNIRSRVDAFQGKMEIHSSAQGTEIHIELDLTKLS